MFNLKEKMKSYLLDRCFNNLIATAKKSDMDDLVQDVEDLRIKYRV